MSNTKTEITTISVLREKPMTNETKYTPGKWQVHERYRQSYAILAYDDDGRLQTQKEIAWVGWSSDKHDEENLANARLIACAPELLNALEIIENRLSNIPITSRSPEERLDELLDWIDKDVLSRCKQLIAKAKGEAE